VTGAPNAADALSRFRTLGGGLDHPEGVAWGRDGRVYAGGEAGQIYAVDLDGTVSRVADTGGFILGVAVDGAGRVYACDVAKGEVTRIDPTTGEGTTYATGTADASIRAPNWLSFGADGTLYVTDSGDWGQRNGRIWRKAAGQAAEIWTSATDRLPNGCCLDVGGEALLVIETNMPGVTRVPILPDGSAGAAELVVELPGTVPDGIALCEDGSFLVSCYRPDAVYHVTRHGTATVVVEDPQGQTLGAPANICFVGPGLDRVVTSNLGRWHLAIGDLGIRGARLHYPALDDEGGDQQEDPSDG
jgi:gluconolactonase